jgi:HPt (histidine-containing phosphotransfer) domain-containing protein
LQIATGAPEIAGDVAAFKQRYAFAFPPAEGSAVWDSADAPSGQIPRQGAVDHVTASFLAAPLPDDSDVPAEVLEFFVPEAEEHLQTATQCLQRLETGREDEQIHRLFRAIHTIKGSAAQVGLHRVSAIAHRVEDLLGRLRDGRLEPGTEIVDCCLDSVDALKTFLHREGPSDAEMHARVAATRAKPARCTLMRATPTP